jgi:hypothetical protein
MPEKPLHSHIGASSCHRWFECPGSVNMCADIPNRETIYARTGTAAHKLAEVCLKEMTHPSIYLGRIVHEDIVVDEEMIDAVEVYLGAIQEDAMGHFGPDLLTPGKLSEYLLIEQSFHLTEIHKDLYGTNDACLILPFEKIYVYDLKYGEGYAVEVQNNKQLMYYGLGALADNPDIDDVELVIVQPRAFHPHGVVRRWQVTRAQLTKFAQELQQKVKETEQKNAPLKSGEWCRFCPAMAQCPALHAQSMELAKADFTKTTAPVLPEVKALTADQMANILQKADILEDWLHDIKAYAYELLTRGVAVPGFKLVRKKANRKWENEELAGKALEAQAGKAVWDTYLKSPAQMEKLVGKNLVAEFAISPDNGTTIAKEADRREAVPYKPDFKAINKETM